MCASWAEARIAGGGVGAPMTHRGSIRILPALLAASTFLAACGPAAQPCGTFTFNGSPHSNAGVTIDVTFAFNAATCGAPATTATQIAYVQIVRIIDQNTGAFLAPNSDQQNRIVTGQTQVSLNGWAIDRISNRDWGYYGRNDDGTFFSTITTGSNTTNAVLRDVPSGWPDRTWFDAVSVPDCLMGIATCQDRELGFYYWFFIVDSNGTASSPGDFVAREWHRDAVDLSVTEWNNDAASLGKNAFPTLSRMP